MSLILSGTDGLSDIDGTAATPAIRGTDANTGIFFPAADTIAFSEGGAEAMRIDSSGNVGIGTTSPTALGLQVTKGTGIQSGIAVTNPANSWAIQCGASTNYLAFQDQTVGERMRIDSSGNLLVGATATSNGGKFLVAQPTAASQSAVFQSTNATAGNNYGVYIVYTASAPNGTGNNFLECADNVQTRASIRSNGGLANFSANNVNLSDARTKTDIQDSGSYLHKICAIPVRTFKYKDQTDDLPNLGCIAQEVETVAPELVDVSGFGITPDDGIPLKAIYQTDLQYALMKCIQEQQALITALTTRIETLENKT